MVDHDGFRPDEWVIETHELRRSFKTSEGELDAVAGIDLRVGAGEVFGFLGRNGAGKTTTLRVLSTLLPPTGGLAVVTGCDVLRDAREVRRRIGYVGQRGGTHGQVSGRDELVFQGRLYGLSRGEARRRAAELLTTLELEACADRSSATYSGGQRRRLEVGLGLMHRPRLLFLDEPTTGLDPQSRACMWDQVRRLRDGGTTVFLTTHYLEEADVLCDRIAVIDQGRLVAEGSPDELRRQSSGDLVLVEVAGDLEGALELMRSQPFVRESSTGDGRLRLYVDHGEAAMPAIFRICDGAGLELRTIAVSRPSLDDVFLRKTGRSLLETADGPNSFRGQH